LGLPLAAPLDLKSRAIRAIYPHSDKRCYHTLKGFSIFSYRPLRILFAQPYAMHPLI